MKTIYLKNRIALAASLSLAAAVGLQGCANPSSSADVYSTRQAQREQTVRMGTIESIRPVKIQTGRDSAIGVGTVAGGVAGGVVGSTIGGGRGSTLASVGGALAGAALGNAIEGRAGGRNGVEITVRLDNGSLRAITQEVTKEMFQVGERVRLLTANGITRVTH